MYGREASILISKKAVDQRVSSLVGGMQSENTCIKENGSAGGFAAEVRDMVCEELGRRAGW